MIAHQPPGRNRLQPEGLLPTVLRPGSEAWRWMAIAVRSLRVVVGVSLVVAGTGLIGMGVALFLHGLGILRLDISQPGAEALAVGLAIAMIGGAILGLAVESALRSPSIRSDAAPWETVTTGLPALLISLMAVRVLEGWSTRLLLRFSDLFELVPSYLDEVSDSGRLAGLVGLALMWTALQFGAPRARLVGENAPALLYVCWMVAVIMAHRPIGL